MVGVRKYDYGYGEMVCCDCGRPMSIGEKDRIMEHAGHLFCPGCGHSDFARASRRKSMGKSSEWKILSEDDGGGDFGVVHRTIWTQERGRYVLEIHECEYDDGHKSYLADIYDTKTSEWAGVVRTYSFDEANEEVCSRYDEHYRKSINKTKSQEGRMNMKFSDMVKARRYGVRKSHEFSTEGVRQSIIDYANELGLELNESEIQVIDNYDERRFEVRAPLYYDVQEEWSEFLNRFEEEEGYSVEQLDGEWFNLYYQE